MNHEPRADTRDMYTVHNMFRREFAALPVLVVAVASKDAERSHLIADHIDLLTGVLQAHHRAEDTRLWPRLLDRGGEELVPVVMAMERQHNQIEQLAAQAAVALDKWREDPTAEHRGRLADVLDRLYGVLHAHMGMEEELILPLVEKYMTAVEWQAMIRPSGAALPSETLPLVSA